MGGLLHEKAIGSSRNRIRLVNHERYSKRAGRLNYGSGCVTAGRKNDIGADVA